MKTKIEKAWISQRCNECGNSIYPNKVCKVLFNNVKREVGFCESCYNKIFKIRPRE